MPAGCEELVQPIVFLYFRYGLLRPRLHGKADIVKKSGEKRQSLNHERHIPFKGQMNQIFDFFVFQSNVMIKG